MPAPTYDLVIIGGGSAGLAAARVAHFFPRKRVAILDKERLGGDCLHYGCVPSKTLIGSARAAHALANAPRYGLPSVRDERPYPLGPINRRIAEAIAAVAQLDDEEDLRRQGIAILLGETRFLDAHTLRVGQTTITARHVLICTGSRPVEPPIPNLRETGFYTNETIFAVERPIPRLAVIGGGPIGVELGQALARLGSDVTIINHGERLLPRDDAEVVAVLENALAAEGIAVANRTEVVAVRREDDEAVLTLRGAHAGELRVDAILVAVGRRPNVEGLNLEAAGVHYNERGIVVDRYLRTSAPHIYAAGDVTGGPLFTHYAGYQAAQAVRNIFLPLKLRFKPGVLPWVTFTDPEIAHAGLTEAEARARGKPFTVLRLPYARVERAITDRDTAGLMKFIIDERRRFLGCHIAGTNAGELINELALAMNNRLTVDNVIGSVHAYPTYSFAMPIALYDYVLNEQPTALARFGRWLSRFT